MNLRKKLGDYGMELAKHHLDIGIFTNQRDVQLAFWREKIGLPYEELLKAGKGNHQHRHSLNGSVFKLNHTQNELPASEDSGYAELLIARKGLDSVQQFVDPDGNKVSLVPSGHRGITHIGVQMEVRSVAVFQHFFSQAMGFEKIDDSTFKCATTLIFLRENTAKKPVGEMRDTGFRYLTVQVFDVVKEHNRVVNEGGVEGAAPITLGETAKISFVRDPDGNWIEISQRASLTGSLE